jgi:hypothetical protein
MSAGSTVDDPRIVHLRELAQEATAIRDNTKRLIAEISTHLHDSMAVADDRPRPERSRSGERRRKRRDRTP